MLVLIFFRFIGLAVGWAAYRRATRLELARSEVFLELAHTVFGEQVHKFKFTLLFFSQ